MFLEASFPWLPSYICTSNSILRTYCTLSFSSSHSLSICLSLSLLSIYVAYSLTQILHICLCPFKWFLYDCLPICLYILFFLSISYDFSLIFFDSIYVSSLRLSSYISVSLSIYNIYLYLLLGISVAYSLSFTFSDSVYVSPSLFCMIVFPYSSYLLYS